MCAITQSHKRTLKCVSVDSAADFYKAARMEKGNRFGPYYIGPAALIGAFQQCRGKLFVNVHLIKLGIK